MPTLAYVATLNNYTPEDVAVLRTPNSKLRYIIVGHEVGEQGTPHLQIYFQLEKQTMLTTIKRWGGPWSRMHFETARGTDSEAADYCKKEGNFFEIGERKQMGRKGARNDLEAVKQAIDRGESYDEICETHFQQAAAFSKFIKERVQARDSGKLLNSLKERFESSVLKPWQQHLKDDVLGEAHPRKIIWIWDKGNSGKSWMAKYLVATADACYLTFGRKSDLIYIFTQNPKPIVCINLSRTTAPSQEEHENNKKNFLDGLYSLAEDLKDGILVNTKYESRTVLFETPHVVFFANFAPDMTKWTADRYAVINLDAPLSFDAPASP